MEDSQLPDYERPPVVEIVAAVQFVPLPQFGMPEAVAVARAFDGWRIVDVPPALGPIVEASVAGGQSATFNFALGTPPLRLILASADDRWLVQVQQDRIAVHERQHPQGRPSFAHVAPKVREVANQASKELPKALLAATAAPELVEVIYINRIVAGEGWESFRDLHHVLRVVAPPLADRPFESVEQFGLAFSSALEADGKFAGRLHVQATPSFDENQRPVLELQLICRRYVHDREVADVMERCHRDIVEGFTAVTQPAMHEIWGRFR